MTREGKRIVTRMPRSLAAGLALAAAAAIAVPAVAEKNATTAGTVKITASGAGGVKIGRSYRQLRARGLVGKIRGGCELGGPDTRSAPLRKGLRGSVNFTLDDPRKVTDITIRGGGAARGVGIGAPIEAIIEAFPGAKVDHGTDEVFGITLVKIPKKAGGRLAFAVDTTTMRVTSIGVPHIAFCE